MEIQVLAFWILFHSW